VTKDELLRSLRPVTLEDRPLVNRYLARYPPSVSELTFTNVFCWAEVRHHMYCEWDGYLLISYRQGDCCLSFYPPVGPEPAVLIGRFIDGMRDYCWTRLERSLAEGLTPPLRPLPDPENSDYVYRVADLRELKGKPYHGKRNFVRRFAELYHPEVRPLTAMLAADCLHVQEAWLEGQRHDETARDESTALIKALRHFDDLGLSGVAVHVGGELAAFALGEPLNSSTFVEHFEKALPAHTGAYPYLLQAFARSIPDRFLLVNREQDLGLEGLRRAKESWHPALMVEKFKVKIRASVVARQGETEPRQIAETT
jgi:hypothetical protein